MSLKKKEKQAVLLTDKIAAKAARTSNLLLVMTLFLQLILPVAVYANASPSDNDTVDPETEETQSDDNIESPMTLMQTEGNDTDGSDTEETAPQAPEVPVETDEAPPADEGVTDPVEEPEPEANSPPPAPVETPEAPVEPTAPAPAPEEPVEEAETEPEVEEESETIFGTVQELLLDGFPATSHPENSTPIIRFAPGSLGSANGLRQEQRMIQSTIELAPGEVKTSKTAKPVPGMVNTWDITVRLEGRDDKQIETTDVVLVIDRSGSMADNRRMENAKSAAINFINTMIPADANLRIAIVSFSSNYQGAQLVTINREFTRNINQLTNAVNSLSALGGTHTQAGIIQGQELLNGSTADNKYMVLLSDGEPTYSYRPNNWTTVNESKRGVYGFNTNWNGQIIGIELSPNNLNYSNRYGVYNGSYNQNSVVGTGNRVKSSTTTALNQYWPFTFNNTEYYPATREGFIRYTYYPTNLDYIDNGAAAIRAGQDAKLGINGLFTIALQAGAEGTPILNAIASPGMAYAPQDPTDLQGIYDEIGTQIQTQYALRNVELTDVMGDGFSLIPNTLNKTAGVTNVSGNTINWTIDPAVQQLVPGTTDVRYAEMTYRVEINDGILSLDGAKTDENKLFETNKVTELKYTDTNESRQTVNIVSPKVDPVLLKVKKNLDNPAANENRKFNVQITGSGSYNHTVSLVPNADYVWLTNLRHEGTYNVVETGVTGTPASTLSDFIIRYQVDGANQSSFVVNHPGGNPRGDVTIQVTNKQFEDAIPDEPLIRIGKTFSGLTQEQIDQLTDFKITITSQSDPTRTVDLFLVNAVRSEESNGDITYSWVLDGWPAGTYTVTESGEELANYEVIVENDGTVTTQAATLNWSSPNPNQPLYVKPNTEEYNDLTNRGARPIPNFVATKLTQNRGNFVWTEKRLSVSERQAIVDILAARAPQFGLTMENGNWYSGEDIEGTEFYFRGHRIQYDFSTGVLHIPQPNQWSLIVSGSYTVEGGEPADIAVKNTYILQTRGFEFTKVDEIGNPLEGAEFKLEKHDGDDRIVVPNVGTDPIFSYEDLTVGTYTLTETAAPEGYYLPEDATWTFEVVWDEETNQLNVVFAPGDEIEDGKIANYPKGRLPDTGGPGNVQTMMVSIFAFSLLVTLWLWRSRRNEVNPND